MIFHDFPFNISYEQTGDALATWFEARSIREANGDNFLGGKQTETGLALAKLCYDILIEDGAAAVQSVDANTVTPALERVVEANTLLSGLGFEVRIETIIGTYFSFASSYT